MRWKGQERCDEERQETDNNKCAIDFYKMLSVGIGPPVGQVLNLKCSLVYNSL